MHGIHEMHCTEIISSFFKSLLMLGVKLIVMNSSPAPELAQTVVRVLVGGGDVPYDVMEDKH